MERSGCPGKHRAGFPRTAPEKSRPFELKSGSLHQQGSLTFRRSRHYSAAYTVCAFSVVKRREISRRVERAGCGGAGSRDALELGPTRDSDAAIIYGISVLILSTPSEALSLPAAVVHRPLRPPGTASRLPYSACLFSVPACPLSPRFHARPHLSRSPWARPPPCASQRSLSQLRSARLPSTRFPSPTPAPTSSRTGTSTVSLRPFTGKVRSSPEDSRSLTLGAYPTPRRPLGQPHECASPKIRHRPVLLCPCD